MQISFPLTERDREENIERRISDLEAAVASQWKKNAVLFSSLAALVIMVFCYLDFDGNPVTSNVETVLTDILFWVFGLVLFVAVNALCFGLLYGVTRLPELFQRGKPWMHLGRQLIASLNETSPGAKVWDPQRGTFVDPDERSR